MEYKQFNIALGLQIKKMREAKNLSQSELASLMNINAQNVSSYERGERCPSMFWMHRLYTALEITPVDFVQELYGLRNFALMKNKDEKERTIMSNDELKRRAEEFMKKNKLEPITKAEFDKNLSKMLPKKDSPKQDGK